MKATVNDILEWLERVAPFGLAESWDNVGLLIGDPGRETNSLMLGLDPTMVLLEEAISRGADTLITHHPCIFRPFPSVHINTPGGAFLERALSQRINVIACHTNFDNAAEGVSDALAVGLKLTDIRPLRLVASHEKDNTGLGRIGSYPTPLSFPDFIQHVYRFLEVDTIQVAGTVPERVQTVALCGGSGSDLAEEAHMSGADIYLSSEIKHSTARWAEEAGLCIIDGTHYSTESPAITLLAGKLESQISEAGWEVEIHQTQVEKPPFSFFHKTDF